MNDSNHRKVREYSMIWNVVIAILDMLNGTVMVDGDTGIRWGYGGWIFCQTMPCCDKIT